MIFDISEGLRAGLEAYCRTRPLAIADNGKGSGGLTQVILLLIDAAIAINCQHQVFGQRVDYGYAHAMQATGDFIGIVIEFSASMQNGHDDLGRRAPFFGVYVYRNTAAIVRNSHRFIGVNGDRYDITKTRQRFIN